MTKKTIFTFKRNGNQIEATVCDEGSIIKRYRFGVSKEEVGKLCFCKCLIYNNNEHCRRCVELQEKFVMTKTIKRTENIYILDYSEEDNLFGDFNEKRFSLQDLKEAICEKICDSEKSMCCDCLGEDKFCYIKSLLLKKEIKREDN